MALRELLLPWDCQPQEAVQIDSSIAAWDIVYLAPARGTLAGPKVTSEGAGAVIRPSLAQIGLGVGYAVLSARPPSLLSSAWTECGFVYLAASSQICPISARPDGQVVYLNSTSGQVDLLKWDVASIPIGSGLAAGLVSYVARRNGSEHKVWINGRLFGTATEGSATNTTSGALPAIGAQAGNGGYAGTGPLSASTLFHVARTPAVLAEAICQGISGNPWRIFEPLWLGAPRSTASAPTLSTATYAALTSTTARPRVSLTF